MGSIGKCWFRIHSTAVQYHSNQLEHNLSNHHSEERVES